MENTTNEDTGIYDNSEKVQAYKYNQDGGAHGSANLDLLALTWKQMDTSLTLGRQKFKYWSKVLSGGIIQLMVLW